MPDQQIMDKLEGTVLTVPVSAWTRPTRQADVYPRRPAHQLDPRLSVADGARRRRACPSPGARRSGGGGCARARGTGRGDAVSDGCWRWQREAERRLEFVSSCLHGYALAAALDPVIDPRPILVVEDDQDDPADDGDAARSERLLHGDGGDGAEALRVAAPQLPCLVLLDLIMRVIDGVETRAAQLAMPRSRRFPWCASLALQRRRHARKSAQGRVLEQPLPWTRCWNVTNTSRLPTNWSRRKNHWRRLGTRGVTRPRSGHGRGVIAGPIARR